ncbi:MAG TPA: MFS transporter [Gaiellaceae bacterium]|jgi:MFS family permease|nr:MFS transporter [Gaiellaceae bacterium]
MRAPILVLLTWLVLMAGANLATPLYGVYSDRFGFSTLVLTLIFVTYAFLLVPALIVFGRLSDRIGRRPVMLAGLAAATAGLVLFAAAQGTAWLFGARALQGLAVGMIGGAATAALVELDPDGNRRRAALFAGLAQAGGSAVGPLVAGTLAQWAPEPLRLCYLVGIGATLLAAGATFLIPERDAGKREPWRIQWPRVPPNVRTRFALVSLTAATVWAAAALYLSVVPLYAAKLLHTHDLALLAAVAALALVGSCLSQMFSQRHEGSPRAEQLGGLAALAVGLLGLVLAAPLHSLAILLVGAVLTGVGHGFGFLGAQQELNELAPAERRGEVTAAFISAVYFLVASAVIGTGLLGVRFSLSVSVGAVAFALVAVALGAAAWHGRLALAGPGKSRSRGRSRRRPHLHVLPR